MQPIRFGPSRENSRFCSSSSYRIIFLADEIESGRDSESNCAVTLVNFAHVAEHFLPRTPSRSTLPYIALQ